MDWLMVEWLGKAAWLWLVFFAIVVVLLVLDLGVLSKHRGEKEIGARESLLLSAGYIGIALLFGAWVTWYFGRELGLAYSLVLPLKKFWRWITCSSSR